MHNLLNLAFMAAVAARAEGARRPAAVPAADASGAPAQNVFMAPTPLFHVTANNCLLHPATISRSTLVLTYKWDAARALELIERERVTNFSGVPTMSREMLMHPDWATRDTSSLVGLGGGGAACSPTSSRRSTSRSTGASRDRLRPDRDARHRHRQLGALYVAKPASCGRVVPTLDASSIDDAGRRCPTGGVGELCVRGSVVIKGYLNRAEATAEAIRDGWFHTGDIATIDEDGFVFIVDRAKDMVLRGGENVYCSEVETAIYEHDASPRRPCSACPTIGSARSSARRRARAGRDADRGRARDVPGRRIAKFKIPRRSGSSTSRCPRNANGKFVKRELRENLIGS